MRNKLKIVNDPVYGFINIPGELIFDLIEHPYFQRLRRISQMGLSYLVYPGARHTRFHHALGCMYLMQKAVQTLRFKGVTISEEEEQGLYIAILLHDIGHGPFSHAMEHSIVEEISHEEISLRFMQKLNEEFQGKLTTAIQIFQKKYPRSFLNELVSSQLDIDRLDYLKRDSFYTGVAEGNINSERIIAMLNVKEDKLVIEEKGIYSVEKFLVARRLMYWQVYLHKTSISAELLLIKILKRAKELVQKGEKLAVSSALSYFISKKINAESFSDEALSIFAKLDDYDIISAMKEWENAADVVLSRLSKMILNRQLLRVEFHQEKCAENQIQQIKEKTADLLQISLPETEYFVFTGEISNMAYNKKAQGIFISEKDGTMKEVTLASDQKNLEALSEKVTKYFVCYPKEIFLSKE